MESQPKILIISSSSPSIGPAIIGLDYYNAFKQEGHDVDFLTLYKDPKHPDYLGVLEQPTAIGKRIKHFIERAKWHLGIFRPDGYEFFYKSDYNPPVRTKRVLDAINKDYDIVFVLFWQRMLSFKTISEIYDRLHCSFVFSCVDYSPMSGGCHFTKNCERYKVGCGKCPAFHSNDEHDFTYHNVQYRKMVYDKVKPIVFGNQHMAEFYKHSFLLKNYPYIIAKGPIINTDVFCPKDKVKIRQEYKIQKDKFIVFFGCQHLDNPRKGISYLVDALNILHDDLTEEECKRILVITAGSQHGELAPKIPFDSKGFGLVAISKLPDIYSLADCYICPSIDDAGPMMVNQAICCGTPVVGFDMGAVNQIVKENGLGYVAKLRDAHDLAMGMKKILNMSHDDYVSISQKCRKVGVDTHSYKSKVEYLLDIVKTHSNNYQAPNT